jgi:CheY-like chemotaxis protein
MAERDRPQVDRAVPEPSRPRGLVLVVEDEADLRALIVGLLEGDGYAAIGASNGEEALQLLREGAEPPSLILLDLMMPRMDGWAFRAAQRADPALASIPVVVVTGYGSQLEARPLGAVATLPKPFDLDALLQIVDRHCGRRSDCAPDVS